MDGIIQFLLIVGIIVIGIVKQFKKEAKKNADDRELMPLPEDDMDEDVMPIPEGWDTTYGGFIPKGPKQEPKPALKEEYQFSSSKHIFAGDSANTSTKYAAAQHNQKTSPPATIPTIPNIESEYAITSEEEARKAIVWSEILQRKY